MMSDDVEQQTDSVNPAQRSKLSRLGDQLDAAQKAGDVPTRLIREYRELVRLRALTAPLPKVVIKTVADYWEADKMSSAAFDRYSALKAEIDGLQYSDEFTWRHLADLQAMYAVARRNWLHIIDRINARSVAKKRSKAAWQRADRIVTIPQRDRQVRHG